MVWTLNIILMNKPAHIDEHICTMMVCQEFSLNFTENGWARKYMWWYLYMYISGFFISRCLTAVLGSHASVHWSDWCCGHTLPSSCKLTDFALREIRETKKKGFLHHISAVLKNNRELPFDALLSWSEVVLVLAAASPVGYLIDTIFGSEGPTNVSSTKGRYGP